MEIGFYTALGTPLQANGMLDQTSFVRHVEDQITCEASGLLIMGSMGLGVFMRDCDYVNTVRTAITAAKGACPIFVGVTDTSIGRVCDRIDAIRNLKIDGIVATAPYYYSVSNNELVSFYREVARFSPFPVYLYDLPSVARNKINIQTMIGLGDVANIKGIKTADLTLIKRLAVMIDSGEYPADFGLLYSGLDTFATAYEQGIKCNLDGMFACTGPIAKAMYRALEIGDHKAGHARLREIIHLRDVFVEEQIFPSFTYAMNLLGYSGNFHPDFYTMPSEAQKEKITASMAALHLI